ncbi:MAG: hypothetical protein B5766_01110 [Candidatus Lumbricidophila eiseniae]|uniref:Asparagine synthase n=1 Tax=Candidatus Lumbricidiphila eiseniae TaxID=1969409 RepID=A0A2A6FUD3_9MICO|nr:MAG: hypothetical protein B5766_01110 [Candidatus Lumbricidophila eiseniae]
MKKKWWRRRQRFKPFDRRALPLPREISSADLFAEGLLVAESAARIALRNRFVVGALRGDEPFTSQTAVLEASRVLTELAEQCRAEAARTALERETATERSGRSQHQHDYHRADAPNLRRREQVQEAIATEFDTRAADPAYLDTFVERAREDAWEDVADAIRARLDREWRGWPRVEVDSDYVRDRDIRLELLRIDLERASETAEIKRYRLAAGVKLRGDTP